MTTFSKLTAVNIIQEKKKKPLNSEQEVRQTRCHHNFHTKCINLWLEKVKHEFSVCRQQLEQQVGNQILQSINSINNLKTNFYVI